MRMFQINMIYESKPEDNLSDSPEETIHGNVVCKVDVVEETLDTRKTQDAREIGTGTKKDLNEVESFKEENTVGIFNRNTEKLIDVVENNEIGNIEDKINCKSII